MSGAAENSERDDPLGGAMLHALIGPTASGKSALALAVAERAGAEIVSLDAFQIYRGMDVGTAKPRAAERARVRHHMIDLVEPSERYDVARFLTDLRPVFDDLNARGVRALVVGGTGFYLKALVQGLFRGPSVDRDLRRALETRARVEGSAVLHAELERVDPTSAARLHPNDTVRIVRALEVHTQTGRPLSAWQTQWRDSPGRARRIVGLELPVAELDRRIAARARAMLEAGWPAEAAHIRATCGFGSTAVQALGYAEALALHDGTLDFEAAVRLVALHTRQFARRQRTWYRKFGETTWLAADPLVRSDVRAAHDARPDQPNGPDDRLVEAALASLGW